MGVVGGLPTELSGRRQRVASSIMRESGRESCILFGGVIAFWSGRLATVVVCKGLRSVRDNGVGWGGYPDGRGFYVVYYGRAAREQGGNKRGREGG